LTEADYYRKEEFKARKKAGGKGAALSKASEEGLYRREIKGIS